MKAVLRSALIFYAVGKLQRAFLGVSLSIMVAGPLILTIAPRSCNYISPFLFFVQDFLLLMALGATLALGTVTFRAASALHTLQFIPYARLRLVGGILLGEVILAILLTINTALLHRAMPTLSFMMWGSLSGTFIGTLALMTLWILWVFCLTSDVLWVRWTAGGLCLLGPPLAAMHPKSPISAMTGISAADFFALVAIIASSLFAVWYLRVRRVGAPDWRWDSGSSSRAHRAQAANKIAATGRSAVDIFMLGRVSVSRACWVTLSMPILYNAMMIIMLGPLGFARAPAATDLLPLMVIFIGSAGTQFGSGFAQRSKSLWINGGYTRRELFEMAEALSLRCLAFVAVPLLALSAVEWLLFAHDAVDWRFPLLLALSTAICGLYIGLTNVKREWWNSTASWVFCCASAFTAVPGTPWFLDTKSNSLPFLLPVIEVVAALGLRALAQRRWEQLDWLICKPKQFSPQGLRPVA